MSANPARHSIWLLAAPRDERLLAGSVRDLAARFGTPRFHPHLTLAGDLAADAPHLLARLDGIVAGIAAPLEPIVSVDVGESFFRSFYARFPASQTLVELRRRAHLAAGAEEPQPFLPHVSLAYGVAPTADRDRARAEWTVWLDDTAIRFDRVAVVRASDTVPIEDWTILAERPLAAAPAEREEAQD